MVGSTRPAQSGERNRVLRSTICLDLPSSQMTIALAAAGLDPGIGIFHADKEGRAVARL